MSFRLPIRTRWWALLSILVAFSVFNWGFQYKLSLYNPPGATSSKVPIAKLLSKNEQPLTHQDSVSVFTQPVKNIEHPGATGGFFPLLIMSLACLQSQFWFERRAERSLHPQRAALHALFVRPPPASV